MSSFYSGFAATSSAFTANSTAFTAVCAFTSPAG
jgi:hypothetical protein